MRINAVIKSLEASINCGSFSLDISFMRNYYPFKLGEQYEKWEFDLEILDKERIKGCDSYIYLKPIYIFDIRVSKVELVFSLDTLIGVYLIFMKQAFTEILLNKEIQLRYNINKKEYILYYNV